MERCHRKREITFCNFPGTNWFHLLVQVYKNSSKNFRKMFAYLKIPLIPLHKYILNQEFWSNIIKVISEIILKIFLFEIKIRKKI
jgi:hypothetical protein